MEKGKRRRGQMRAEEQRDQGVREVEGEQM